MREVGAFEAKNKLSALLDQVERGSEIVITCRGRPVAKLVPPGSRIRSRASQARRRRSARSQQRSYASRPQNQGPHQ